MSCGAYGHIWTSAGSVTPNGQRCDCGAEMWALNVPPIDGVTYFVQHHTGQHHEYPASPEVAAYLRGKAEGRQEAIDIVVSEPELEGDPPPGFEDFADALLATVRATKNSILRRLAEAHAVTPTPEEK